MNDLELYHWGIKGQKWGQRRFQNPDGSLTELGKERYGRYENGGKRVGASTYRKGDAAYLSDAEMRARIDRIKLEQEYLKLLPDERSKTQKFMQDVVAPAAVEYGKKEVGKIMQKGGDVASEWVEKKLKEKLGIDVDVDLSSAAYKIEDMARLSTDELNKRSERLEAENKYRKRMEGDFSNDNKNNGNNNNNNKNNQQQGEGKNKNKGKGGDDDGRSIVNNIYINGDKVDSGSSKNKGDNSKNDSPKSEPKNTEASKQAPVKHIPTPENARMPQSVAQVNNKISTLRDNPKADLNSSIRPNPVDHPYYTNDGGKSGKWQYSAPPQKVDPRVFSAGEKEVRKITEGSRYDVALSQPLSASSSQSYINAGKNVLNIDDYKKK